MSSIKNNNDKRINKRNSELISNLNNFSKTLEIPVQEMVAVANMLPFERYVKKTVKKKDGSDRHVYAPIAQLKRIQTRIKNRIFANQATIGWPSYIYGSIPKQQREDGTYDSRDYVICADQHSHSKSILTVDIKDFFDNVHADVVEGVIKRYVSKHDGVVELLTNLCCYEGHLVQGAPTSSYLANLSISDVEPNLVRAIQRKNLTYTRLVDDITVSSKIYDYDFSYVLKLIENALSEKGLYLNKNKINVRSAGSVALTVHGLRVDYQRVRLPAAEVGRIRAHVKMLENVSQSYKSRTSFAYQQDYARCMGRVNKLARVGHKQHSTYLARLKRIQPLPSGNEEIFCVARLERLEKTYALDKAKISYRRNFYRLQQKLFVLSRSFPRAATGLKERLRLIPPNLKER